MITRHRPLNIAHRGARSIAPENTLAAARKAFEAGADMWEMDVAMTADGNLVVIHDDTLKRTSNAAALFPRRSPWKVQSFSLEEIRHLDFGSWYNSADPFKQIAAGKVTLEELQSYVGLPIPTLREALEFTRELDWRINVELKNLKGQPGESSFVQKAATEIEKAGMVERTLVSSFQHAYLQQIKEINPAIATAALVEWLELNPVGRLRQLGARAYHPGTRLASSRLIHGVREQGYDVNVWTVNKETSMRKLLRAGVSGIITDFPQLLKHVLDSYYPA